MNVICTDKTGTLTENKMTVTNYFLWDNINKITEEEHTVSEDLQLMLNAFVICSNATYKDDKGIGDPTEIALHIFTTNLQITDAMLEQVQRIAEFPLMQLKSMSVLVHDNEAYTVYTKGAIVRLLEVCSLILIEGKQVQFTETHKTRIKAVAALLSDDALRTLGVAYKIVPQKIDADQLEQDLVFVGMVGMYDPPREAVKPVIALAKSAGISVVMITGDHKNTAFAIAQNLGIANNISEVMSGPDFDKISPEQSKSVVNNIAVFARVSPEHKVNIVNALKSNGNIVAMTGDGVNDAPSLSAADIGIAMGKSGTDVARSAADIILTDDNFETIIKAVEKGRNIYQNIKNLSCFY
ncbi:MAG: HAD-IC family P-type ATPase [Bacteroidetes bacterium]|nr:HAD-IC family P-type ATPase [Bacteroidota bacterium]